MAFCLALFSCFAKDKVLSNAKPISYEYWDVLLKKHVNPLGQVNYQGFIEDSLALNQFITLLEANHPNDSNWSQKEQIAYWINAYNAYTIRIVIRHYPLNSIRDIAGAIPFINSVWDLKFIQIEQEKYTLNNIEHGILRSHYAEPRIHFALVCASQSCPLLLNEAYTAANLDRQLDAQAKRFINDPTKNQIQQDQIKISKIFRWYKRDFTESGSLIQYINQFSEVAVSSESKIEFLDYDWSLNKR